MGVVFTRFDDGDDRILGIAKNSERHLGTDESPVTGDLEDSAPAEDSSVEPAALTEDKDDEQSE
jgi:hypothetical protein